MNFQNYYNVEFPIYKNNKNSLKVLEANITSTTVAKYIIKNSNEEYFEKMNTLLSFKMFLTIPIEKITKTFTIENIIEEFKKYLKNSPKIYKIIFNQDYKRNDDFIKCFFVLLDDEVYTVIFPFISVDWNSYLKILRDFASESHPIEIKSYYKLPHGEERLKNYSETELLKFILHVIPREHMTLKFIGRSNSA